MYFFFVRGNKINSAIAAIYLIEFSSSDYIVIVFLWSKRSEWHLKNLHFCHGLRIFLTRTTNKYFCVGCSTHSYTNAFECSREKINLYVSFVFTFSEFSVDVLYGHYLNCKSIFFSGRRTRGKELCCVQTENFGRNLKKIIYFA